LNKNYWLFFVTNLLSNKLDKNIKKHYNFIINQLGGSYMNTIVTQTELGRPYEVWDKDFVDIACGTCAEKFAEELGLEWRGGTSFHSFTEDSEEKGAGASCIESYALGDSDYPYSCCGVYLDTSFTKEGEEALKEDFPTWVVELYGYKK
jgi:tRNA A37 threonylcarbamoyltransferase TsaD